VFSFVDCAAFLFPAAATDKRQFLISILPSTIAGTDAYRSRQTFHWGVRRLRRIEFEPYAPVRDQLHLLLRAVNRYRQAAGLDPVPATVLRLHRRPVRPFA
jgi:hypothetical protein